jgi:hypothetical protein
MANFVIRARDQTREAFASVNNRLNGLSRMSRMSLGGLGSALSVAALVRYGRQALTTADQIDNMSKRMRLGHESVQSMGVLLREAGLPTEALGSIMDRLTVTLGNAQQGNASAIASFDALGLSLADLENMTPEQALEAVSRHLARNQGDARSTAAASEVLGRSSGRLTSVLQILGNEGFAELNKRMRESKNIMETDMVRAGDIMEQSLSRAMNRMTVSMNTFFVRGLSGVTIFAKGIRGEFDRLHAGILDERTALVAGMMPIPALISRLFRREPGERDDFLSAAERLFGETTPTDLGGEIGQPIEDHIVSGAEKAKAILANITSASGLGIASLLQSGQNNLERTLAKQNDYLSRIETNTRAGQLPAVAGGI